MRACLLLLGVAVVAQDAGWRANPEIVQQTSARQPGFNYDEARVSAYTLPAPLAGRTGTVGSVDAWRTRRTEILELFREHVYGRSPGKPAKLRFDVVEDNPRALDGAAALRRIAVISEQSGREHRFELIVFLPNGRTGPARVFLLLNNRPPTNTDPTRKEKSGFWPIEEIIARGYGIAALQVSDLAPDDKDRFLDGAIQLFEGNAAGARAANAWGALAAWAWGALERTVSSSERPIVLSLRGTAAGKLVANPFYLGQAFLPAETTLADLDDAVVLFDMRAGAQSTTVVEQALPVESLPGSLDLMAIEYEGSKQLKVAEINERLRENGIRVRLDGPLDGATACVIKEVHRDLLEERGFADAEVTQRTTLVPARGTMVKKVTFTINDGERSGPTQSAQGRSQLPPAARCNR